MSTTFKRSGRESSNASSSSDVTIVATEQTPLLSTVQREQLEWVLVDYDWIPSYRLLGFVGRHRRCYLGTSYLLSVAAFTPIIMR